MCTFALQDSFRDARLFRRPVYISHNRTDSRSRNHNSPYAKLFKVAQFLEFLAWLTANDQLWRIKSVGQVAEHELSVCGDEDGNLHITIRPEKITGKWQYSMSRYGSFESDMFEYVGDISKTKSFERIARVVIDEKDKKYAFRGNREVKWETISISEAKSKLVPFLVERHTTWAELFVAGTPTKDYKEFVNTFCESFGVQKTLKDITMGYYGKPSEHFIVRQAKSGRLALLTLTGEWPDQGLYILKTCMPLLTSVPLHKPQIRQGVVRFCREHGTVAVDKLYAQSVHKEKSHGANDESAHWAVGGSSDLGFAVNETKAHFYSVHMVN
ncbi:hypothetical protein QR680_000223 [Steinernema hermaphroditum]|uniref:Uncharacterized protein n=1 Tax=Steinernema hermaphroditum TaxID=289476 RepID=A0AA39GUR3_9BILA|nr:hypothetical protein QR680_000223 [Steinernema hermaphroditum]